MSDTGIAKPVSTWRKVVAAILDFFTVFFIGGYIIGSLTGNTSDSGFSLNGMPAIILFVVIVAYFWIGYKYANRTIWQRLLRAR